jgi:hypothetical protein
MAKETQNANKISEMEAELQKEREYASKCKAELESKISQHAIEVSKLEYEIKQSKLEVYHYILKFIINYWI